MLGRIRFTMWWMCAVQMCPPRTSGQEAQMVRCAETAGEHSLLPWKARPGSRQQEGRLPPSGQQKAVVGPERNGIELSFTQRLVGQRKIPVVKGSKSQMRKALVELTTRESATRGCLKKTRRKMEHGENSGSGLSTTAPGASCGTKDPHRVRNIFAILPAVDTRVETSESWREKPKGAYAANKKDEILMYLDRANPIRGYPRGGFRVLEATGTLEKGSQGCAIDGTMSEAKGEPSGVRSKNGIHVEKGDCTSKRRRKQIPYPSMTKGNLDSGVIVHSSESPETKIGDTAKKSQNDLIKVGKTRATVEALCGKPTVFSDNENPAPAHLYRRCILEAPKPSEKSRCMLQHIKRGKEKPTPQSKIG